jgi:hypothetical protein
MTENEKKEIVRVILKFLGFSLATLISFALIVSSLPLLGFLIELMSNGAISEFLFICLVVIELPIASLICKLGKRVCTIAVENMFELREIFLWYIELSKDKIAKRKTKKTELEEDILPSLIQNQNKEEIIEIKMPKLDNNAYEYVKINQPKEEILFYNEPIDYNNLLKENMTEEEIENWNENRFKNCEYNDNRPSISLRKPNIPKYSKVELEDGGYEIMPDENGKTLEEVYAEIEKPHVKTLSNKNNSYTKRIN